MLEAGKKLVSFCGISNKKLDSVEESKRTLCLTEALLGSVSQVTNGISRLFTVPNSMNRIKTLGDEIDGCHWAGPLDG